MKFDEIKSILASEAEKLGLKEYETFYMQGDSLSTETLKNEISSFSSSVSGGVSFRCVVNGKMGYASTELFTKEELAALVKRAASNAECVESDNPAIIFAGSPEYKKLCGEGYEMPTAEVIKEKVLSLQEKTYAQSEYVTDGTQTAIGAHKFTMGISNSHGLELINETGADYTYVVSVVNRDGEAESEFSFVDGIDDKDIGELPKKAVDAALNKLGATFVNSGSYDVVISGKCMSSFLSAFSSVFSAKAALLGLSLLKGKENEKIAADCITITDDPMREGAMVKTPFDGEGVATYRKDVVENGVLKTLLYDMTTAAKTGKASTGNGQRGGYSSPVRISPYNFYINAGKKSEEELVLSVEKGIYVTELKGLHAGADATTGDFSVESAGFIIENGKKGGAVKSFTVAGNFFDLLRNVEAISNEVHFGLSAGFTVFGSPDILVRNMSIAGK